MSSVKYRTLKEIFEKVNILLLDEPCPQFVEMIFASFVYICITRKKRSLFITAY